MEKELLDDELATASHEQYADFGIRLVAFIIDGAIFTLIGWAIWGEEVVNTNNGFHVQFNGVKALLPIGYFFLSWIALSGSLGKMAVGLKIVDEQGKKINPLAAFIRTLGFFVVIIGCWFMLGNEKKQALHDKAAKTFVIKKKKLA